MYRPEFRPDEPRVHARHFQLPDPQGRKIAYTYIKKNGCSNFKVYLKRSTKAKSWRDQAILAQRVSQRKLEQGNWDIRIFIYRDPFQRLLSAFLNKFVRQEDSTVVLDNFEKLTGRSANEASFSDLLGYIEHDLDSIDAHFWPQKAHLAEADYNMPIPIKELSRQMIDLFGSQGPASIFTKPRNASAYSTENDLGLVHNIPVHALQNLVANGVHLNPENFRAPEVYEHVRAFYQDDYNMMETLSGRPAL
jgi:hypothetical protein